MSHRQKALGLDIERCRHALFKAIPMDEYYVTTFKFNRIKESGTFGTGEEVRSSEMVHGLVKKQVSIFTNFVSPWNEEDLIKSHIFIGDTAQKQFIRWTKKFLRSRLNPCCGDGCEYQMGWYVVFWDGYTGFRLDVNYEDQR